MFRSLRTQLSLIFVGFLLLVGGSVLATFLVIQAQSHDAAVINLAGRQRMLNQQMTLKAIAQPGNTELTSTIQRFEQTLYALRDGGIVLDSSDQSVTIPPAPDEALRTQLDEAAQRWLSFRGQLEYLATLSLDEPARATAEQALQAEAALILADLEAVVKAFEARAQSKLLRLQIVQAIFFIAALLLLIAGYSVIQQKILRPLATLRVAAQQIADGELSNPIPALNNNEFSTLRRTFEKMRLEIAGAREKLESSITQRTHELVTAFEFSQEIVAQLELDHLLKSVTNRAQALTNADEASLCLLTLEDEALELVASSGQSHTVMGLRQSIDHGIAAQVVGEGQTITTKNPCTTCGFLNAHTPGQCIAAPLQVGEKKLGALCVVRNTDEQFDPHETRALTLLANSAAIAIANAQLVEVGRRQAEQAASLGERERLAAELHDHLAQTLSFLNLKTERLQELLSGTPASAMTELEKMKSAIETAYKQVRAALVGLREPPPAAGDLSKRLATCITEFREISDLSTDVKLVMDDLSELRLPRVTQTQVIHIIREALTNIRRHACAQQVWVHTEAEHGWVRFVIEDDGCGFDPQRVNGDHHLGLAIMRARAERTGGNLSIDTAPNEGTRIVASFPLHKTHASQDQDALEPVAEGVVL